ncbi:MAG: peptidoglycan-associated lipoprotein Pal [Rhodocyclaceae bacterium]|nr:MAG: peptidoglycan-associated lipoprotein Pal [Rhodocyclaceae bacterium]
MMRTFAVVSLLAILSGCSSEPAKPVVPSNTQVPATKPAAPVAVSPVPPAIVESEAQRLGRGLKLLSGKSVYFSYDDYSVKAEFQDLIKQHLELLKASPSFSLTVEGNADERGSVEYNLALGQKRAEAVKRNLKMLGLPEAKVEAISYGKEKPRAVCHEEKCWAENRRVDFEYKKASGSK